MKAAPPLTAEELLARATDRNEDALAELYDRFAPALLGLLLRILADRAAAEEVLQEVFARLASDGRRIGKEGASVSASLVLLARALAIDRVRTARRRSANDTRYLEPVPISYAWLPRPDAVALVDGRRDLFHRVINELPKAQREMLDLALFLGFTETEIAQKVGEPLARVRSGLLAGASFIRHRLAAVMRTWAANI